MFQIFSVSLFQTCLPGKVVCKVVGLPAKDCERGGRVSGLPAWERLRVRGGGFQSYRVTEFQTCRHHSRVYCLMVVI